MTGTELRRALARHDIPREAVARRAGCPPASVKLALEARCPSGEVVAAADALLHDRRMWEVRKWGSALKQARDGQAGASASTLPWLKVDEEQAIAALRRLELEADGAEDVACLVAVMALLDD